jgi:hypothetical protein
MFHMFLNVSIIPCIHITEVTPPPPTSQKDSIYLSFSIIKCHLLPSLHTPTFSCSLYNDSAVLHSAHLLGHGAVFTMILLPLLPAHLPGHGVI